MAHDLNDLAVFAMVVECGSFTAAATQLGVAKSHVSQRVARLEERLRVRLIQRTTRRLHVTELGRRYYRHCRQMLLEADRAQRLVDAAHDVPGGNLRIACPPLFSQLVLGPIVVDFLQTYPRVHLHIDTVHRAVDVIEEGYDVAFRILTEVADSTLVARSFGTGGQTLVASPGLLAAHPPLRRPEQLADLPSVDMVIAAQDGRYRWRLRRRHGEDRLIEHRPCLVTDDLQSLRRAASAGIGIALLPDFLCRAELARGTLQPALPGWFVPAGNVHAVYASRRGLLPAVRDFLDFATPRIEARLVELAAMPSRA